MLDWDLVLADSGLVEDHWFPDKSQDQSQEQTQQKDDIYQDDKSSIKITLILEGFSPLWTIAMICNKFKINKIFGKDWIKFKILKT